MDLVFTGQLLWRERGDMEASWAIKIWGRYWSLRLAVATSRLRIPKASRRLYPKALPLCHYGCENLTDGLGRNTVPLYADLRTFSANCR